MSDKFDDRYFDLTMKILNYAIEFVKQPSYASTRMTDVLQNLIDLSAEIEGVNREDYDKKSLNPSFLCACMLYVENFFSGRVIFHACNYPKKLKYFLFVTIYPCH
ncbi:unnamed protein product [marine sediment metagenome]|uniref:Uncharacterized protein n=1 Tax=marine sediment metagenome TaxID=412755 RepID=X1C141_9ZZZZ